MDAIDIIDKYYGDNDPLRRLLIHHSEQVKERAISIAQSREELNLDKDFIVQAAMLHDIGIFLTNAPSIYCHGEHPYLLHGYLGGELMRSEGLFQIARVCERHTGTGLTVENIRKNHLPLPEGNYLPETLEEKVICYADKFYSKSHPLRERTIMQTAESLRKYGEEGVKKFMEWAHLFEPDKL